MFSKNNLKPIDAFVKDKKFEECKSVVFRRYYDLPNDQVLYWTQGNNQKTTKLKVFSIHDLKTSIRDKEFNGDYRLLCLFPDGTLLFDNRTDFFHRTLIRICSNTLTDLSTQPWESTNSAAAIDNNHFFIISKDRKKNEKICYLTIFKLDNGIFVEDSKTQLSIYPNECEGTKIYSLGQNRYAYHVRGHNTSKFSVFIFDLDPNNKQVQERGVIKPQAQHSGSGSAASGECVVLQNGQLLTYHNCHDHVQIWDTESKRNVLVTFLGEILRTPLRGRVK
jgi:hypothetical protein